MDFDLRQLEIFCKVVDLGSFSKAAQAVHLAQASVSERVANLEKAVGSLLLDRLGRQVVPTKAGELLYKHATLLLDMKRTARLEMEAFLGRKQGEVTMGGSTIPGEYILPRVLGRFHAAYPFVSVLLSIGDTDEVRERVLSGELELGVVGSKSADRNLIYTDLWRDELVLAVPSLHKWANKKGVTLKEVARERFILREVGSGTLKIMEDYLRKAGLPGMDGLRVVARLGTSTAVKEGVKSGLGISILSVKALETEMEKGVLKALKVKGLPMSRTFYLLRDRRRAVSPLCQALIDFLKSTSDVGK
jgi:DNA-binding transcriptional LysR family regulator